MATKPKKKTIAKKLVKKPAKKLTKKPAKNPAKKAASAQTQRSKGPKAGLAAVVLVAVLVLLAGQALRLGKKQAAQDIQFVRVGSIMPKSRFGGIAMTGDSSGNFFRLNGRGDQWEIHKYSEQGILLAEYEPHSAQEMIIQGRAIATGSKGQVYVLEQNGTVKIFSSDLSYLRQFKTGENGTVALDLDSKNRIYVLSQADRKVVVFSPKGLRLSEFGGPGSNSGDLSNPFRIAISTSDRIVVLESIPSGPRAKIFSTSGELKKTYSFKEIRTTQILYLGIDPENRIFMNDHASQGIVIYDSNKGKFIGRCIRTVDKQLIQHPGGVGVNKFTGRIYVDYIPGYMQCVLP